MIQYKATGTAPYYRGIYFNSTNNFIYIGTFLFTMIHVCNLNLSLSHNISTLIYQPWSIAGSKNQMYVGTTTGTILVIENEVIIRQFNGCNDNLGRLAYILFDDCGMMVTTCNTNQLYLYYPNGTFTGKSFTAPTDPRYIGYDSKGRFVLISWYEISIYN